MTSAIEELPDQAAHICCSLCGEVVPTFEDLEARVRDELFESITHATT